MDRQSHLRLFEDDADAEQLGMVARNLRDALLPLDVGDVRVGGEAPLGTRAIDVAVVGGRLIGLGGPPAASRLSWPCCVTGWHALGRRRGPRASRSTAT